MQIENKRVEDIIPYENNPRKNDPAVEYVARSINDFGFKVPIILDKNNVIVTGHTRLKAAKYLGMSEVPCIYADDLTDEQIKAFRLADNKVAEYAEWDPDLLKMELDDILDINMEDFGFDLNEDEDKDIIEDEVPEVAEDPISKVGDIYKLGDHILMCGDSTNSEDVSILMDGNLADMMLTDPPYNVEVVGGNHKNFHDERKKQGNLTIQNDNMSAEEFHTFLVNAFKNAYDALKPGGVFYCWYASRNGVNFRTSLDESGLTVKQQLIWNKGSLVMGMQDYHWKHEPCLYGWKEGAAHYFIDDRRQTTVIEDKKPDFKKMKKEEMQKLLEEIYSDKISTTIINEDRPHISDLHPTMKPVKLMARQIKNSSRVGDIVLDLFGGSGSTLMACEQLGRVCYMMEYDPKYVDVIVKRWESFTNKKAEKIY